MTNIYWSQRGNLAAKTAAVKCATVCPESCRLQSLQYCYNFTTILSNLLVYFQLHHSTNKVAKLVYTWQICGVWRVFTHVAKPNHSRLTKITEMRITMSTAATEDSRLQTGPWCETHPPAAVEVGPSPMSLINCYRPWIYYNYAGRFEEGQTCVLKHKRFNAILDIFCFHLFCLGTFDVTVCVILT